MYSVGAITPSALPGLFLTGKANAGLDAQLAQYQIQLADWTNCPSCNTPEGKAKIQELTNKISETQERIRAAEPSSQSNGPAPRIADQAHDAGQTNVSSQLNVVGVGATASPSAAVTGTIGGLLNIYA